MEVQFTQWGDSVAFRLPSDVAERLAIVPGSVADLDIECNRLVIAPRGNTYRLDDLVAAITPENLHREVDTGPAVGAEVVD